MQEVYELEINNAGRESVRAQRQFGQFRALALLPWWHRVVKARSGVCDPKHTQLMAYSPVRGGLIPKIKEIQ